MEQWIDRAMQICQTNLRSSTGYHGRVNFLRLAMMITDKEQIQDMMQFLCNYLSYTVPRFTYVHNDQLCIQTDDTSKLINECLEDQFRLDGIAFIDSLDAPMVHEHELAVHDYLKYEPKTVVKGLRITPISKPLFIKQFVPYSKAAPELRGQFRQAFELGRAALFVRMVNKNTMPE